MTALFQNLVHMLQIAAMVGFGFALLSLLEGEYTKKLLKSISRRIRALPQRKAAARSHL
jgi:hypothetical protein